MPSKKFPRTAPCPCGSGKKYRDCCCDKGFEYLVDEDGTILKSLPMSDGLAEIIEEQKRKFQKEHGREIGPNDKLFFDAPPLEHVEHYMVEAMQQAGLDATKELLQVEADHTHLAHGLQADVPDNWPTPLYDNDARQFFLTVVSNNLPPPVGR